MEWISHDVLGIGRVRPVSRAQDAASLAEQVAELGS